MPYSLRRFGKIRRYEKGKRVSSRPKVSGREESSLGVNSGIYELVSLLISLGEV